MKMNSDLVNDDHDDDDHNMKKEYILFVSGMLGLACATLLLEYCEIKPNQLNIFSQTSQRFFPRTTSTLKVHMIN